jgi:hypothetical protein
MAKRMNIILEDETAQTINRAAKPGERSRFINRVVQYYAAMHSPVALRARLKHAALRDRDLVAFVRSDNTRVDIQAKAKMSLGTGGLLASLSDLKI